MNSDSETNPSYGGGETGIPAPIDLIETPTEKPGETPMYETPTEKPVDETPTEKPVDETPTEKPVDETPTEKPVDETPTEKPVDETPTEKPGDETPIYGTPKDNPPEPQDPNVPTDENLDHVVSGGRDTEESKAGLGGQTQQPTVTPSAVE
jgi:hypothetical protein